MRCIFINILRNETTREKIISGVNFEFLKNRIKIHETARKYFVRQVTFLDTKVEKCIHQFTRSLSNKFFGALLREFMEYDYSVTF